MKDILPPIYKAVRKLYCEKTDEKEYLCHYRKLKTWVKMGMEVTTLQRVKYLNKNHG